MLDSLASKLSEKCCGELRVVAWKELELQVFGREGGIAVIQMEFRVGLEKENRFHEKEPQGGIYSQRDAGRGTIPLCESLQEAV